MRVRVTVTVRVRVKVRVRVRGRVRARFVPAQLEGDDRERVVRVSPHLDVHLGGVRVRVRLRLRLRG